MDPQVLTILNELLRIESPWTDWTAAEAQIRRLNWGEKQRTEQCVTWVTLACHPVQAMLDAGGAVAFNIPVGGESDWDDVYDFDLVVKQARDTAAATVDELARHLGRPDVELEWGDPRWPQDMMFTDVDSLAWWARGGSRICVHGETDSDSWGWDVYITIQPDETSSECAVGPSS